VSLIRFQILCLILRILRCGIFGEGIVGIDVLWIVGAADSRELVRLKEPLLMGVQVRKFASGRVYEARVVFALLP
jgi:hypothetical protein